MDAEPQTARRRRRDALLEELLDLSDSDRSAFLDAHTADDPALRTELEALIVASGRMSPAFLDPPLGPASPDTAPPQLAPGTALGRYVIEGQLGSGGMSAVYAARDPMVGRAVAIKVLAPRAADDAWRQRFLGELRILGRMVHDHVVRVYDFGEDRDLLYLVMERLNGEDLGKAIAGSRTGNLERRVDIAEQIARALRDVHAAGVIHRDLKPANVFVTLGGRIKLIDFGISRSHDGQALTQVGLVAGTPEYMAPERLAGGAVSPLGDIYSYGALLFELFSGKRQNPPQLSALPVGTPRGVAEVIRRTTCAEPADRLQTFEEILDLLGTEKRPVEPSARASREPRVRRVWMMAAAVVVVMSGVVGWRYVQPPVSSPIEPLPAFEITQATSRVGTEQSPNLSPDGRWLLFDSRTEGNRDIYLQAVGSQSAVNLTRDTPEDDTQPAFSPDGESIVFRSERQGGGLFIMGRTGDSVRRISSGGFNPAWSPDGQAIAASTEPLIDPISHPFDAKLLIVQVSGGRERALAVPDAMQPNWSPHGHRIAYWAVDESSRARDLWTVSVTDGSRVRLTNDPALDWNPIWAPSGRYLYFLSNRNGTMNAWRVGVEEETGQVRGSPELMTMPTAAVGHLSIAASGQSFAFSTATSESSLHRLRFDPDSESNIGAPVPLIAGTRNWRSPALSFDGTMVAFTSAYPSNEDLWTVRIDGTGLTQLTNDAAFDRAPRWSPDGKQIVFFSDREGSQQVWVINADGSALHRVSNQGGRGLVAPNWTSDGRRIYASTADSTAILKFDPEVPWSAQTPESFVPVPVKTMAAVMLSPEPKRPGLGVTYSPPGTFSIDPLTEKWTSVEMTPWFFPGAWLPGNRRILGFCSDFTLCVTQLDRKTSKLILDVPSYGINTVDVSRDGRTVVFAQRRSTGDIYLARATANQDAAR